MESVVFEQLQSIKNSIEYAKYTPKLISEKIEGQEYCKGWIFDYHIIMIVKYSEYGIR